MYAQKLSYTHKVYIPPNNLCTRTVKCTYIKTIPELCAIYKNLGGILVSKRYKSTTNK